MATKQYNIKVSFDSGNTYIKMYPSFSKSKLIEEAGDKFDKYNAYLRLDNVTFANALSERHGQNDFDIIFAEFGVQNSLPFNLYYGDDIILAANLELNAKYDLKNKTVELGATPDELDKKAKIRSNYNVDFNWLKVLGDKTATYTFESTTINTFYANIVTGAAPTSVPTNFFVNGIVPIESIPEWDSTKKYGKAYVNGNDVYMGLGMIVYLDSEIKLYYSLQDNNENYSPELNPTHWQEIDSSSIDVYAVDSEFCQTQIPFFVYAPFPPQVFTEGFYGEFDSLNAIYWQSTAYGSVTKTIESGRLFSDAWQQVIKEIDSTILFDTSNDVNNGWCNILENDVNFQNLLLFQISAVKFGQTNDVSSSFENVSLGQMFELMYTFFNVEWLINENGYFQFVFAGESVVSAIGSDLTKISNYDQTANAMLLSLDKDSDLNILKELFSQISTDDVEFGIGEITYDSGTEEKSYKANICCNDVIELLKATDSQIQNNGICLISVDGSFNIISSTSGKLREGAVVNAPMSSTYLLETFQPYGRPKSKGIINGVETQFEQTGIYKVPTIQLDIDFESVDSKYLYEIAATKTLNKTGARVVKKEKKLIADNNIVDVDFVI